MLTSNFPFRNVINSTLSLKVSKAPHSQGTANFWRFKVAPLSCLWWVSMFCAARSTSQNVFNIPSPPLVRPLVFQPLVSLQLHCTLNEITKRVVTPPLLFQHRQLSLWGIGQEKEVYYYTPLALQQLCSPFDSPLWLSVPQRESTQTFPSPLADYCQPLFSISSSKKKHVLFWV